MAKAAETDAVAPAPPPAPVRAPASRYQYSYRPREESDEDEEERERRKRLEKRRREREKYMAKYRAELAKQAAYTRDTTQARGRGQAYATEAEKLMGGQTGYGSFGSYARFGLAVLDTAVEEVKIASEMVKKLTKDVKAGIIPRSDLETALSDLERKAQTVADLKRKSGLSGFGESKVPSWGTIAVGVALTALVINYWPR
jgi:hypothetical protein